MGEGKICGEGESQAENGPLDSGGASPETVREAEADGALEADSGPPTPTKPPPAGGASKTARAADLGDDAAATRRRATRRVVIAIVGVAAVMALVFGGIQLSRQSKYDDAKALYESGGYASAKAEFLELGSFSDSADLVEECQKAIDYDEALDLYAQGAFEEARAAFDVLSGYREADDYLLGCEYHLGYAEARDLMAAGDYQGAYDILNAIPEKMFNDRGDLLTECSENIQYQEAQEALAAGERESAFDSFTFLGDFKDSAALAASCLVEKPGTGETYHNESYSSVGCKLTIQPPDGDSSFTYVKMYSSDGTLVSCAFINPGGNVTVDLPAGDYKINTAYGDNNWFGDVEMFGDGGSYLTMLLGENQEIFTLEYGNAYTLYLRTSDGDGSAVGSKDTAQDSF